MTVKRRSKMREPRVTQAPRKAKKRSKKNRKRNKKKRRRAQRTRTMSWASETGAMAERMKMEAMRHQLH